MYEHSHPCLRAHTPVWWTILVSHAQVFVTHSKYISKQDILKIKRLYATPHTALLYRIRPNFARMTDGRNAVAKQPLPCREEARLFFAKSQDIQVVAIRWLFSKIKEYVRLVQLFCWIEVYYKRKCLSSGTCTESYCTKRKFKKMRSDLCSDSLTSDKAIF